MFTITFRFESGEPVVISANAGEKLLDVARKANVAIDAPCSGNGVCGKCRVRLVSGYLDAPINRHITSEEYAAGWRLACLAQISGDAEIEVPDIASAYRSRMKMADLSSPEEIAIFEDLRRRLEEAGRLTVYSVEHSGRLRKFYRITPAGIAQIEQFLTSWPEIARVYDFIKESAEYDTGTVSQ